MNRKMKYSLVAIFSLSLAVMVSPAIITATEVSSSNIILKDMNNDGLVDVVDSQNNVFWNQGNHQFSSNDMIITKLLLSREDSSLYYAINDPINATSLISKPPLFVYNSIHIEEDRSLVMNNYNLSATFYKNNGFGTYLPKWFINPALDFILFLHIPPITDIDELRE